MRRMLLILAHDAIQHVLRGVEKIARVPFDGKASFHRGRWCYMPGADRSPCRIVHPHPFNGLTDHHVDVVERGRVLTIATYAEHYGGGDVLVFLTAREVTGDAAAAMARGYDEWLNTPDEAEATVSDRTIGELK